MKMKLALILLVAQVLQVSQALSQKPSDSSLEAETLGSSFNPNPLAGLNGSSDEESEDLPALSRIKKDKNPPKDNAGRKLRVRRQRPVPEFYPRDRVWSNVDPRPVYQPENPVSHDPVQKIVDSPIFRGQLENKRARHRRSDENEEFFNSGIQYRAYGSEAGTGRSAGPEPRRTPAPKKSGPTSTQRPPEIAPQIDENFVSNLFKHPEAVKIVFDYLEKEKALTSTTTPKPTTKATTKRTTTAPTTTKAAKSKAPKPSVTPPPKPISANQAKINRLNSLFGLALLATENNKDNNNGQRPEGQPENPDRNKRPEKIPSLASFFAPVEKSDIKKKSEIPSLSSIFSAIEKLPQRPEKVENPLLTGEKKPDLQFFGPSDFVPKSKYSLPVHTNGPMKLKYVSAKDFPFNTPFGIVPIPR